MSEEIEKQAESQPLTFEAILDTNGEWRITCRLMRSPDPSILKMFLTDMTVAAIRGHEILHTPKIQKPGGIMNFVRKIR